jgi:hypothetical protein
VWTTRAPSRTATRSALTATKHERTVTQISQLVAACASWYYVA